MNVEWKGVMPALLTPFTAEDTIDFNMFEMNAKAQIKAGVHGLILAGSLGEASTLSQVEINELTQLALALSPKDLPVIVNVAEASTKAALEAIRMAEQNGAHGLMILPPMRYKASDRETVSYFSTLAESTELPIMIYNNPVDYGIEITINMFEKLLKHSNIQAVKESTRDTTNVVRFRNAFGTDLKILTGVDTLAMESLMLGADGWVAGLVDAFPAETVALYNYVKNKDYNQARVLNEWFFPLLELDVNPRLVQNIKLAASLTGIGTEHVRAPRLPLEGYERSKVLEIIQKALENRPQFN